MSWQGILGHDAVADEFRRRTVRGRLAGTYLFVGPSGVGKRSFALRLAQSLLCAEGTDDLFQPCGSCPACRQVLADSHPDLFVIQKPADKNVLPIDLFIGPRERRMKEGLCHDLGLKPFMGGRKIAVIDDADYLSDESANCLLKTLEEPPPGAVLFLIASGEDRVLPTVRSRCQIIRFRPLSEDQIAELLVKKEVVPGEDEARRIAAQSEGSMGEALELAAPELWEFRREFLARLAEPVVPSVELARLAATFIDQAGREAVLRRERARKVVRFVLQFYRQMTRTLSGLAATGDPDMIRAVETACGACRYGVETAATCAERCLDALENIDRFAHQAAWLECWLDDLGRISQRGERFSA